MIRTIARRLLLIIALSASILAFGAFSHVSAYNLYELENKIANGDFSVDTDGNGLADNWGGVNATYTIVDGKQKATATSTSTYGIYQSRSTIANHVYYVRVNWTNTDNTSRYYIGISVPTSQTIYRDYVVPASLVFTALYSDTNIVFYVDQNATAGDFSLYDNIMLIDLTAQFGAGLEPSLADFELLYMPADLDYFDTYESFDAGSYTQVSSSDYANLGDDITSINFSRSVIDTYGENIDINIYAYFFDTDNYSGNTTATYYRLYNNPVIEYLNRTETLSWIESDYSERVLLLEMTDEQNELLRRALFDRHIGGNFDADFTNDDGFLMLDVEGMAPDSVKFYVVFSSTFDLRVDISSFLISYDTDTHENLFSIVQQMYFKCQDKYDRTLLPAIELAMSDYDTIVIDNVGSQYTDVQSFNVEFEFVSPDGADDSIVQTLYLYELGVFSSNNVVIGNIDTELPLPFEPGVCDWYEFGCQAKNGANEFVAWFYETLDIAEIVGYFDTIVAGGSIVLSLMPDSLVAAFTVIGAGIIIAVSLAILHKLQGSGGD